MPDDLNFQNISTVQNETQPKAKTIASAATIAPTTMLTKVTGTTGLENITPPVTGDHVLWLMFTGIVVMGVTGNIGVAYTSVALRPIAMVYDSAAKKYYPSAVV